MDNERNEVVVEKSSVDKTSLIGGGILLGLGALLGIVIKKVVDFVVGAFKDRKRKEAADKIVEETLEKPKSRNSKSKKK